MNTIAKIYGDKKITASADGSVMFYSLEYNEAYRAKSIGAFTESLHKFVKAAGVVEKSMHKDVRILDICFGLGYNCAVTFEYASREASSKKVHIVSIEKDPHLPFLVNGLSILWPVNGYEVIRECLGFKKKKTENSRFSMEMHIMDAINAISFLTGKFDAIYFDPFSFSKNPEMWSIEVFRRMADLLDENGVLATYACGKQVRSNMAAGGLDIIETSSAGGAFHPGTICTLKV